MSRTGRSGIGLRTRDVVLPNVARHWLAREGRQRCLRGSACMRRLDRRSGGARSTCLARWHRWDRFSDEFGRTTIHVFDFSPRTLLLEIPLYVTRIG